ncbi:MAG: prolyl-tRNA synthetase associated domain-containing protein [Bacteroidales bacterium]|nr:prolyl-tRNA synthetase associated domain-containing protein [Bacteroidales bacterium]
MNGQKQVYDYLQNLNIKFTYYEHPPAPTVEEAAKYWKDIEAAHCKNLFFRNHKGKMHYLVVLEFRQQLNIRDLEQRLKQGKISFASDKRLNKYLGLQAGSVSPFGLINDIENHVHLFLDQNLLKSERISFHPNINTASLVINTQDFLKYLKECGNTFEFIQLWD